MPFIADGGNIKTPPTPGFAPDGGNINQNPLFGKGDLGIIGNTALNLATPFVPGMSYGREIIGNEFNRMVHPDTSQDTNFLSELSRLPVEAGKDVVNFPKNLMQFLGSSVATPALTAYEALPGTESARGKSYANMPFPLNMLSGQQSYQTQRKNLKNQGAGEVVSDTVPVVQWLTSVLATKGVADKTKQLGKQVVTSYQNMTPEEKQGGFIAGTDSNPKKYTVYRGEGGNNPASNIDSYGKGEYYSTDPDFAAQFGKVKKSTVQLDNPLILNTQDDLQSAANDMAKGGFVTLTDWAKSKGYDGIVDNAVGTVIKIGSNSQSNNNTGSKYEDNENDQLFQSNLLTQDNFEKNMRDLNNESVSVNKDNVVTLYRGSSKETGDEIRPFTYFTTDKKTAKRFGNVSEMKVDVGSLIGNGKSMASGGLTFQNPIRLIKTNGVYKIPNK